MNTAFKAAVLAAALAATAGPGPAAADEIAPRIAPESPSVIRNTLRQLGVDARQVTVTGPTARVDARVDGQPVTLEVDRFGGAIRVTQAPQALQSRLQRLQPENAVVRPDAEAAPVRTPTRIEPRPKPELAPKIVPVVPRIRIEPRILVPQD